ncbi:hypothetical protein JTE90_008461 [Oedothorax gibbosus]|uniref:Uncharacterized protein n=1 Tax=Oedothorax gibbosus TaxID=931172 RepID=A0AAV6UZ40_9ARAC|nr:hypothetical protein JTE90_008461 [Oedothorax gibbosus]
MLIPKIELMYGGLASESQVIHRQQASCSMRNLQLKQGVWIAAGGPVSSCPISFTHVDINGRSTSIQEISEQLSHGERRRSPDSSILPVE